MALGVEVCNAVTSAVAVVVVVVGQDFDGVDGVEVLEARTASVVLVIPFVLGNRM